MAIQRRETKSGTVRWIARWRDKGGREHSRSFSKRADAKAVLAEIDTRHARGADTAFHRLSILELYNRWLDSRPLRQTSRSLYEHTRDKNLVPLHHYPATELTKTDVQQWAEELRNGRGWVSSNDTGLSETGVTNALRHLRSAMQWGMREELVARNPVYVRAPGAAIDTAEIPTAAEIQRVIELVRLGGAPYTERTRSKDPNRSGATYTAIQRPRPDIADMMVAATMTGLRVSELAGLNVTEIDLGERIIRVRMQLGKQPPRVRVPLKTRNSRRDVPIPPELTPLLAARVHNRAQHELVFTTTTGRPLNTSHIAVVVKRAAVHAKAERVHFHALRHYYASTLLTAGVPIQDVAAVMGHTVAMTLSTYAHVQEGYQDRVRTAASSSGIFAGTPALRVIEGGA